MTVSRKLECAALGASNVIFGKLALDMMAASVLLSIVERYQLFLSVL